MKLPKLSSVRPRVTLRDEDAVKLMKTVVKDKSARGRRDFAILDLMLHTALRRMSIVAADITDFDRQKLDDGSQIAILLYRGKGHLDKDQTVVVPGSVLESIDRYLGSPPLRAWRTSGPLFLSTKSGKRISPSSLRDLVIGRFREAGVFRTGLSCHSIRHTAASKGRQVGADVRDLMVMLGHSNEQTTEGYLHSFDRVEKAPERLIRYGYEDDRR